MSEMLYVPYKSLKQKQKARIADWMYRETLRYYLERQRMPETEELEQLCQNIYIKIRSGKYRVVYEEIRVLYEKRLEKYALRVQRMLKRELHWNLCPNSRSRRKPRRCTVPRK